MPFDSYCFVLLFLPAFAAVWKGAAIVRPESLGAILLGFSVLFCLWASPAALLLFACLIPVNYVLGLALAAPGERDGSLRRRSLLLLALLVNFAPLALSRLLPLLPAAMGADVLPAPLTQGVPALLGGERGGFMLETARLAGLSFWVLIQTAWLMGIYQRRIEPEGLLRHAIFSMAFPCLLAGPVVRYEQMGPQYDALHAPGAAAMACGLGLFTAGLAKKVLLADWLGVQADAVFGAAAAGFPLTTAEAWTGALAFSLQIYFDFSAYTDMALGIGAMSGLHLPDTFATPYRSPGFIEIWRRWHITFSAWLRDCVFKPLAGPWGGPARVFAAMAFTMLLAALWHGSSATFLIWAGIHLFFLLVNVVIRAVRGPVGEGLAAALPARLVCGLLTFLLVTLAWAVFRSDSPAHALSLYQTLFAMNGAGGWFANGYFTSWTCAVPVLAGLLTVFVLPPARAVFMGRRDGSRSWLNFTLSTGWAVVLALTLLACLAVMARARPFIF